MAVMPRIRLTSYCIGATVLAWTSSFNCPRGTSPLVVSTCGAPGFSKDRSFRYWASSLKGAGGSWPPSVASSVIGEVPEKLVEQKVAGRKMEARQIKQK